MKEENTFKIRSAVERARVLMRELIKSLRKPLSGRDWQYDGERGMWFFCGPGYRISEDGRIKIWR